MKLLLQRKFEMSERVYCLANWYVEKFGLEIAEKSWEINKFRFPRCFDTIVLQLLRTIK